MRRAVAVVCAVACSALAGCGDWTATCAQYGGVASVYHNGNSGLTIIACRDGRLLHR